MRAKQGPEPAGAPGQALGKSKPESASWATAVPISDEAALRTNEAALRTNKAVQRTNESASRPRPVHRRGSVRALAPASIVALVATGVAVVPHLASAAPDLPPISPQALLVKAMQSDVTAFSGTVALTANLGLPQLPNLSDGDAGDPLTLLTGTHTLQVAADAPDKARITLLGATSDFSIVSDGTRIWTYDSSDNSVATAVLPAGGKHHADGAAGGADASPVPLTPQQAASRLLAAVTPSTQIAVDGAQSVAGQAAYTLVLTPKASGSLIARVELAIDAANGAPLRAAVYAAGSADPAYEVEFTSISFSEPPSSRFSYSVPTGASVTPLRSLFGQPEGSSPASTTPDAAPAVLGQDWLSVLEVHGVSLAQLRASLAGGDGAEASGSGADGRGLSDASSSVLAAVLGSGRKVSGAFGSGQLFITNLLSVLITEDGRLFVGAVTPAVLEADAAGQGTR